MEQPATQLTAGEVFYASLLEGDDRAVYDRAPGDADLTGDIHLLRALIGRLCEDGGMTKKEAAIRQAIGILYRLGTGLGRRGFLGDHHFGSPSPQIRR